MQGKLNLNQKLIILAATAVFCVAVFLVVTSYLESAEALRKEVNNNLTTKMEYLHGKVENFLNSREAILLTEAAFVENSLDDQRISRRLEAQYSYLKDEYSIMDIYIGYPDGTLQSGSRRKILDIDWRANERNWYVEAEKNPEKINYTEVYADVHTGSPVMTLSKWLENGECKAVIALDISLLQLVKLLEGEKLGEMGYPFILHKDGRFLIHPQYRFSSNADRADTIFNINQGEVRELGTNLLNNEMEMFLAAYRGREKMYLAKRITDTDFYLVVGMDQQEFRKQMNIILLYNVLIIAIAVLSFGLIVYIVFFHNSFRQKKEEKS